MADNAWSKFLVPVTDAGVAESIVRQLGELLASGVIRPGERLPSELELTEQFEVAPMTVRNALQALREGGLIDTRRGRHAGSYVREDIATAIGAQLGAVPTAEEFTDFIVWREAVSGEASARAAQWIDDAASAQLRQLSAECHRLSSGSAQDYRFADAGLHLFIAELAGSARLVSAEQSIQATMTRTLQHVVIPPNEERFHSQGHDDLVDAICRRDPSLARQRLSEHVRSSLNLAIGLRYVRPAAQRP